MTLALPLLLVWIGLLGNRVAALEWKGEMVRRDVPKLELVARGRGEDRLVRRGNATVEYLRYAAQ